MDSEFVYKIHPAIGIARVGNAERDQGGAEPYFIGPELPGVVPKVPAYKLDKKIRPQAARFRVWAYRKENGKLVPAGEVLPGRDGVKELRWTVHLANRKASFFKFDGLVGEAGRYHSGKDILPGPKPECLRNSGVKDRASLDIDPGPRVIAGRGTGRVTFSPSGNPSERWPLGPDGRPVIDYLGELRTDEAGRLLVIGGMGLSKRRLEAPQERMNYANNDDWFDDVSDGPVTAEVVLETADGERIVPVPDRGRAWVLVGPPDFSPGIPHVVTLWNLLCDVAVRFLPLPDDDAVFDTAWSWLRELHGELHGGKPLKLQTFRPVFQRDVEPLLVRARGQRWLQEDVRTGHGPVLDDPALADPSPTEAVARVRSRVMERIRPPPPAPSTVRQMPKLFGDDYEGRHKEDAPNQQWLALPPLQYAILQRWAAGQFVSVATPPAAEVTPWGLDQAALENCAGGSFFPGIDVGWQCRHPELYLEPFRIRHGAPSTYLRDEDVVRAGHFSRQMALPWQADFLACTFEPDNNMGWWPAARPVHVAGSTSGPWAPPQWGFKTMVAHWSELGFVVQRGEKFVEAERGEGLDEVEPG
ncbi:LodA/GoxA family CTQ-dependent oxidase [Pyxidicoccus parkwayensis]|uniref:LodA/GoxA family CTQ-dependent oxidase n=1 Tax=Pyxidicoccus parkwayensis TaxID=2813578 RepID=A0ABX7NML2_9BACT|nr:LodA/GoxA family CTQ-dependent oxidase [Pyxidicoccus parkwaysis]QSQ20102.1 LodA/GoxA family CTQ-dependent oxidase [Pyxidicoccus parkwaysis]